jgi:nicotinamide-nucleotide amidase
VSEKIRAAIISVGTELTEGIVQDAHIRFLASELTARGFFVFRAAEVPDLPDSFRLELVRGIQECRLVVLTGGLGPTSDDLTRELVAEAAGVALEFHHDAWEGLKDKLKGRGAIPETNRKQATAPKGFSLLPNPNGTAPGFHGVVGDALVIALPGPPAELRPMFYDSVAPLLEKRFPDSRDTGILWGSALLVPESALEEALVRCRRNGINWGTRVDEDHIAFSLRGGAAPDREALLGDLISLLGEVKIRRGDVKPARLLTDALRGLERTLVTAESCTGGLLGKWMTDLPGSSRVYWGGFTSYSDESKEMLLGVERRSLEQFGAVSKEVAVAMAAGALQRSGADVGLAVSGIAGPEGGTPEKPVGTIWAAVGLRGETPSSRSFLFSGNRDMIRRRTAVATLLFTEARLLGKRFP